MKKYLNIAFAYLLAGLAGGVFFREFTKFNAFTGVTALGFLHVHLLVLGMVVFLLVALFSHVLPLERQKAFRPFLIVYNIGLPFTVAMLAVRGVCEVLNTPLSAGANAAISGLAGIAHILLSLGLILLFSALRRAAAEAEIH